MARMGVLKSMPRRFLSAFIIFASLSLGAPIAPALIDRARTLLGCRLWQMYGMAETCLVGCILRPEDHVVQSGRLASCGRPFAGVELRILDADGAELGSGETLWLECNAGELNGVSFAKGCYVGQENTARMHYRAKINRRLIVARLSPNGDRTRISYPDLGLMVEHRRVEAIGDAIVPDWLASALNADQ